MTEQLWHFVCVDCGRVFNDTDSADTHLEIWDHTLKGGCINNGY